MKTTIIYHSFHHGNTEKLVRSFSEGIELIPAKEVGDTDLSKYDLVGLASGIYAGKFAPEIYEFIERHTSELKRVFLVYTSGSNNTKYGEKMKQTLEKLGIEVIGVFSCLGYNTFGPFKLIGGKNKGRPNAEDLRNYREFLNNTYLCANKV